MVPLALVYALLENTNPLTVCVVVVELAMIAAVSLLAFVSPPTDVIDTGRPTPSGALKAAVVNVMTGDPEVVNPDIRVVALSAIVPLVGLATGSVNVTIGLATPVTNKGTK